MAAFGICGRHVREINVDGRGEGVIRADRPHHALPDGSCGYSAACGSVAVRSDKSKPNTVITAASRPNNASP
jgi:hypothetical protein